MKKYKKYNKNRSKAKYKENNKKKNLIGFIIAFIMISSMVGYMYSQNSAEIVNYNDYIFKRQANNNWIAKIDGDKIAFNYLPEQVDDIEFNANIKQLLDSNVVQFTYDPNQNYLENIAQAEYFLANALEKRGTYPVIGLTIENDYNIPIITCDNATQYSPVVDFVVSNETNIMMQQNCIIVQAKNGFDFIRAKDRLLYSLYGVI